MGKPENKPTGVILKWLNLNGIRAWRNQSGKVVVIKGARRYAITLGRTGSPDIVGYLPDGTFLGIEVKSEGGQQKEAQVEFQRHLEEAGGVYILAYELEDVVRGLEPWYAAWGKKTWNQFRS